MLTCDEYVQWYQRIICMITFVWQVLSGAMDGKLCLWSERTRSQCVELRNDSTHPISKVISDVRYNVAMSCSYDGSIALWSFDDDIAESKPVARSSSIRSGGPRGASAPTHMPAGYLAAHTEPVMECGYRGDVFISGDKAGSIIIWDLAQCKPKTRFRAHPGPVTAVDCAEDRATFISSGTDGYVKVWDPRMSGSGLVHKIPAHVQQSTTNAGGGPRGPTSQPSARSGSSALVPAGRGRATAGRGSSVGSSARTVAGRGSTSSAPPANAPAASPISCMAVTTSRGSSSDMCYIVTGSGSPTDSSLAVIDVRQGFKPVSRWDHHRNGVYSLCVVGDECILSGDGMGTLLCHHLLASELDYPRNCLKYGIGASQQGAVRAIHCLGGKVVTAGEDGKVMVFDYDASMFGSG
jgi:WD40 repeat protein